MLQSMLGAAPYAVLYRLPKPANLNPKVLNVEAHSRAFCRPQGGPVPFEDTRGTDGLSGVPMA